MGGELRDYYSPMLLKKMDLSSLLCSVMVTADLKKKRENQSL